ncbi:MAG: hypothetical protein C4527_23385 [Candidatus Omnitrophota bacterium]|jgi:sialic acid synthase SpsE|nr:MAG: hypothetical protein C4527_23385 [Candidatus Omnitrophota bacterium]
MRTATIGNHRIGEGHPPFFVAELGICHGGKVDVALQLTEEAVKAGAHCIKTETFQRQAIVLDPSITTNHLIGGERITEPLIEHMEKYELTFDEHHRIKKKCDDLNIPFMATAHDFEAVDFLVDIGAAAVKISSPDIIHFPLLRYVASKEIPIVMDTGGAFQYEVEIAVKTLRENGATNLIVNHNPAGHPAAADQHDLRIIPRLREILELPIGIADHYAGYEMLYAAAALGANLLEKPISEDRFVPEPERSWSITMTDLAEVLLTVSRIHQALGRAERVLSKQAQQYRNANRMACAAARDLPAGADISLANITFGRPRNGIGVEYWDLIEGKKLRRAKLRREYIQWEDLDG